MVKRLKKVNRTKTFLKKVVIFISKQRSSLIRSSLKMASATFTSRILGLVREQVIAAYFGASFVTDAFNVAYRIPNLLRDLFAEGAFSSAFVPTFTEANVHSPEKAKRLFWGMAIILFIVTSVFSLGIIVFAEELVRLITDDQFSQNQETFYLTVQMARLMSPFLVLISLSALFMGALNSLKIFFIPSLAPAFFNVLMISSIILTPKLLEERGFHPVFSLAMGVVFGGLGQLLIQVPLLIKRGYGPKLKPLLFGPENKTILNRLGIGTIGIAATQINIFVTTILATSTVLGAVSWLSYAFRLFQFPVGILSVSIAGSNLVHFADSWKRGEGDKAKNILAESYFWSWLLVLPALGLMFIQSESIVRIVFERGAFSYEDTLSTSKVLKAYILGLPFYGLYKVFAPTFFTLNRPKLPVAISTGCIGFNLIFCLLTVPHFGYVALAYGTSLSMMLNSFIQAFFLSRVLELPWSFFFSSKLLKLFGSFIVLCVSTFFLQRYLVSDSQPFFELLFFFLLISAVSSLIYFSLLFLLGEKSFFSLLKR